MEFSPSNIGGTEIHQTIYVFAHSIQMEEPTHTDRDGKALEEKVRLQVSNEKNPGCFAYIGDYTTQLYRDFNKPLKGSLLTIQYNGK